MFADNFNTKNERYDLNQDRYVDLDDFFIFADAFGKTIEIEEPPVTPSANQTTILENKVNILYTTEIQDAESATLRVLKNKQLLETRSVTDGYSITFSDMEKGTYTFITLNDTSQVTIPDYPTEIDLTGINSQALELDEEESTTINLEGKVSDPNPEDSPTLNASSLDGKTNVRVTGQNLEITGNPNSKGQYNVRIEAGVEGSTPTQQVISGTIYDLLDIQGTLEDCENHLPQEGVVKVFTPENPITGDDAQTYQEVGEIQVNNSGEFNQRLNQRIEELASQADHLLLQGRMIDDNTGESESYVRTMKLDPRDQTNLEVRVIPYNGLEENDVSIEDFRRHMSEVLGGYIKGPAPDPQQMLVFNTILRRWDFGEDPNADYSFREVVIVKQNPEDRGHFNDETAEAIRTRILNPNDIGAFFNGKINSPDMVRIIDKYDWDPNVPQEDYYGRLEIFPKENESGYANATDIDWDGYFDTGYFVIGVDENGGLHGDVNRVYSSVTLYHESGHLSGLLGHAYTLSPFIRNNYNPILTQMGNNTGSHTDYTPFADEKTAMAIYENTYQHPTGTLEWASPERRLTLRDIASLRFLEDKENLSNWSSNP